MDGKPSSVLDGGVNIPKISLQWIFPIECVGASGMEHEINHAHRFVHAVSNGEPRLSDLPSRIRYTSTHGFPGSANSVDNIGTRCIQDGFSLAYLALDQGSIAQ